MDVVEVADELAECSEYLRAVELFLEGVGCRARWTEIEHPEALLAMGAEVGRRADRLERLCREMRG